MKADKPQQKHKVQEKPDPIDAPKSYSINSALKGKVNDAPPSKPKEEKEDTHATNTEGQTDPVSGKAADFSQQALQKAWEAFAEKIKDQTRLYNMILSKTPKLQSDYQILISLENPLQKEILEKVYNQILFFLRQELQNDKISLKTQMAKEEEKTVNDKRLYTVEEKFQHLKKKNELLDKLKRDLDLDFDY